ncbi:hypothetical protein Bca4012_063719 [Brassica carinata]
MSVVGFDFGNENCLVAVARQRGIDVVLNDESNRETPAIVCFGEKQRFIGTAGAASTMMNPKNSISQIKRLVGRQFSDPELQRDIKSLPFSVTQGPDGYPLIHASYLGEKRAFTPTQVMGMMLSNLKGIAEKNLNAAVCLMDEKDVRGVIKREEFEEISVPILERVKRPLEKALADAGLSIEDVHMVEVVGSGSRVPAIIKILTEFFGKEPRRTMNASECVSRGCALQCAILSPTFKVREFQVHETEHRCFPKGNSIPSVKALTFYRSGTFSVDVQYTDASELQVPPKISTYTIGPFQSSKGERAKLKVKVRLTLHGIVSVESATLLEEEEVEVPVTAEQVDTDKASGESDVNMQDAKETSDAAGTDNGVPESADKPVQMETDSKAEAPKKKVKKTNVPLSELVYGALQSVDVQKAVEKEYEMALQDRVMEETKDRKNAVESYVYDMRNKLSDKFHEYITEPEREAFLAKLQEVEDWLYEDGEDETKGVYVAKLEELKKVGDPIEMRYKESQERGTVIGQLGHCVNSYREAAVSNDSKFDHIELEEKQKVLNECVEAEAWMREKQQQQEVLPKYATPAFLSADVTRKAEALDKLIVGFCRPIMTKPKPVAKPETPPAKAAEEEKSEPQPEPATSVGNADENLEEPATSVKFQRSMTLPGCSTTLSLLGTGFREKKFAIIGVKVYAAGLYVNESIFSGLSAWKGTSADEIQRDSSLFSSIFQGYAVDEGRLVRQERLPCCGIGIGWFLFITGFLLGSVPWYIGIFILVCAKINPREKPGYIACAIAAVLATIAIVFGFMGGREVCNA